MTLVGRVVDQARGLGPGSFALVMATGIVSVDVTQRGMAWLGRALFGLNLLAYAWLLLLSFVRLARYRHEMTAQFATPGRGAAFLTTAAATSVLGTQCLVVVPLPTLARVLAVLGALFSTVLIYLFFLPLHAREGARWRSARSPAARSSSMHPADRSPASCRSSRASRCSTGPAQPGGSRF